MARWLVHPYRRGVMRPHPPFGLALHTLAQWMPATWDNTFDGEDITTGSGVGPWSDLAMAARGHFVYQIIGGGSTAVAWPCEIQVPDTTGHLAMAARQRVAVTQAPLILEFDVVPIGGDWAVDAGNLSPSHASEMALTFGLRHNLVRAGGEGAGITCTIGGTGGGKVRLEGYNGATQSWARHNSSAWKVKGWTLSQDAAHRFAIVYRPGGGPRAIEVWLDGQMLFQADAPPTAEYLAALHGFPVLEAERAAGTPQITTVQCAGFRVSQVGEPGHKARYTYKIPTGDATHILRRGPCRLKRAIVQAPGSTGAFSIYDNTSAATTQVLWPGGEISGKANGDVIDLDLIIQRYATVITGSTWNGQMLIEVESL